MSTDVDLNEIKTRAHTAFRRDGIGHLMAGLSLALMGLFFFDHRQAWAVFWSIGIWYWIGETLRRQVTYPRLGYAKIPPDKRLAAVTGIAILLVLFGGYAFDRWGDGWGTVYWGSILTIVSAGLAWTRRSTLYGALAALFFASGLAGRWLILEGMNEGRACAYHVWLFAAILAMIGVAQLLLFVRQTPIPAGQLPDAHEPRR